MTNRNEVEGTSDLTSNNVPIRNLWHMLSYSWKDLRLLNRWKGDVDKAPSFDALLAKILSNLVSQRLRIGLGRNYRPEEKTLSNLRGRIDFTTSIKKMHFQNAKAHCRYQSFDSNVLKNQIIRSTLNTVSTRGHFGTDQVITSNLRQKLRRIVQRLSHIDAVSPGHRFDTVTRSRGPEHVVHKLALDLLPEIAAELPLEVPEAIELEQVHCCADQ